MGEVLFEEAVPGGATWSHVLKRGTALRLTDVNGGANAGAIFYNAENFSERFNLPDTLKAQHIARLTEGFVLYSDMGRILCSVTRDTLGWHDPLGGCANRALVAEKYGEGNYQTLHNGCYKDALTSFLLEIAKYGMSPRDMCAVVNFFSKVAVDEAGAMSFVSGHSKAGSAVELRAEMNTLVVVNTCQHPLDPNPVYDPKPVRLAVIKAPPAAYDDPCRLSRAENGRGFTLTERYFL